MRLTDTRITIALYLTTTLVLAGSAIAQAPGGHWVTAWGASPHAPLQFPGLPSVPA